VLRRSGRSKSRGAVARFGAFFRRTDGLTSQSCGIDGESDQSDLGDMMVSKIQEPVSRINGVGNFQPYVVGNSRLTLATLRFAAEPSGATDFSTVAGFTGTFSGGSVSWGGPLGKGQHTISAVYSGNSTFNPHTASVTITVH